MKIAILGASSEIARDLILSFAKFDVVKDFVLFGRQPEIIAGWLNSVGLKGRCDVLSLDDFFSQNQFDAIINFIGSGNPAKTAMMGAEIYEITEKFDSKVIDYLKNSPSCKYIFLSSGAVYGGSFDMPVNENSMATIPINRFESSNYYGAAKLLTELKHRSHPSLSIVDVRVFNYFSHTQNVNSSYLMSDLCRSIMSSSVFVTSEIDIFRDYIDPADFHNLIIRILLAEPTNIAVDCYSRAPVSKVEILEALRSNFGLEYRLTPRIEVNGPIGNKLSYYSLSRKAAKFGYCPGMSSIETLVTQVGILLSSKSKDFSNELGEDLL